ncbi:hypothetical protein OUZ56_001447 [Daphnia magna]|uniref:Uncharacterized protein n=1 Tax=Daphnia magna TaxID=35525 RepID=A0ABR0A2P8_9CRUS|nr:hypothetical protein OUZ56_001447 [Daphnia magna]
MATTKTVSRNRQIEETTNNGSSTTGREGKRWRYRKKPRKGGPGGGARRIGGVGRDPCTIHHAHTRARAHTQSNTHNSFGQLRATDWSELHGRQRQHYPEISMRFLPICDINKQKPFRMRLSSETARSSVSDQNKGKSKCQKDRGMAQIFAYDNEQCHRPIRTKVDRNAPSLKDKCSLKLVQNGIKAAVSERQQPKRRPQRRHRPTERNRC